jgi:hypothetical protein
VRGQTAQWVVGAWTKNGDAADTTVRLSVTPTSQKPEFSLGCGNDDGTTSCGLGTVASTAEARQVAAQVTIPTTATSVKSVKLTVTAVTAHVVKDPQVSETVSITAPSAKSPSSSSSTSSTSAGTTTNDNVPPNPSGDVTSPLQVGSLPYLNGTGSTLSPGGSASGLFPTLSPGNEDGGSQQLPAADGTKTSARPVADESALPGGTSVIGAQIVGLCALAVAFLLAVTRLSIRKRPVPAGAVKQIENKPPE